MKKSRWFSDLFKSYQDEIDDLVTDSEGKSVLQKRLRDKRGEMAALMAMIEFSPEMVAVVFVDAFEFHAPGTLQQLVLSEPGEPDFPEWDDLQAHLTLADWAVPLRDIALNASGGDAFLVATAALEFLRVKDKFPASAPEAETTSGKAEHDEEGNDDEDAEDLGEAGADWLAEQGFETPER